MDMAKPASKVRRLLKKTIAMRSKMRLVVNMVRGAGIARGLGMAGNVGRGGMWSRVHRGLRPLRWIAAYAPMSPFCACD